jgi:hypothetical protein
MRAREGVPCGKHPVEVTARSMRAAGVYDTRVCGVPCRPTQVDDQLVMGLRDQGALCRGCHAFAELWWAPCRDSPARLSHLT